MPAKLLDLEQLTFDFVDDTYGQGEAYDKIIWTADDRGHYNFISTCVEADTSDPGTPPRSRLLRTSAEADGGNPNTEISTRIIEADPVGHAGRTIAGISVSYDAEKRVHFGGEIDGHYDQDYGYFNSRGQFNLCAHALTGVSEVVGQDGQDKLVLSGNPAAMPVGATLQLGSTMRGFLFVMNTTNADGGMVLVQGFAHVQPTFMFGFGVSAVKDMPHSINVYWNDVSRQYEIQNNRGGPVVLRMTLIGSNA